MWQIGHILSLLGEVCGAACEYIRRGMKRRPIALRGVQLGCPQINIMHFPINAKFLLTF